VASDGDRCPNVTGPGNMTRSTNYFNPAPSIESCPALREAQRAPWHGPCIPESDAAALGFIVISEEEAMSAIRVLHRMNRGRVAA